MKCVELLGVLCALLVAVEGGGRRHIKYEYFDDYLLSINNPHEQNNVLKVEERHTTTVRPSTPSSHEDQAPAVHARNATDDDSSEDTSRVTGHNRRRHLRGRIIVQDQTETSDEEQSQTGGDETRVQGTRERLHLQDPREHPVHDEHIPTSTQSTTSTSEVAHTSDDEDLSDTSGDYEDEMTDEEQRAEAEEEVQESDLDILGYFRDVPRQHWSCCMLGKLAGDKGFHCQAEFYAARISMRNRNRAHNRKMLFHGIHAIPTWGREIMYTFERCVARHAADFHKCCYVATVEKRERQKWHRFREMRQMEL